MGSPSAWVFNAPPSNQSPPAKYINVASLTGEQREFVRNLRPAEAPVVFEENGKPLAAVVPPWQLESYEENQRRLSALLRQVRDTNRGVPGEDIEAAIEAAVREVRGQAA